MKIKNSLLIISCSLIVVVLVFNVVAYFTDTYNTPLNLFYNADSLYLPTLYDDLFFNNGQFSNWHLTPAPYFFPDMPIYFMARFISGHTHIAILLFYIFQIMILALAIYKLNRQFFDNVIALVFVSISIVLIYLFDSHSSAHVRVSGHHFGAVIIGLFCLYLITDIILQQSYKRFNYVALLILSSLIIASDKLFLVQFIAPICVTLCALGLLKSVEWKKVILIIVTVLCATLLGLLLYKIAVFHPKLVPTAFHYSNILPNFEILVTLFMRQYDHNALYPIFAVSFYIILCLILIFNRFFKLSLACRFLSIFLLAMLAFNIGVLLFSKAIPSLRYMIPISVMPFIFFPFILALFNINKYFMWVKLTTAILLSILISFVLYLSIKALTNHEIKTDYYPKYMQCFDNFIQETGSQAGISEYWLSKHTSILNKNSIKVAQYTPNLIYYNWITTTGWKKDRYDFVLIKKNDKSYQVILNYIEKANNTNMPYSQMYSCNRFDIYYYKNGFTTK